ncbi:MAG: uncharacterized protein JWM34_3917 [Ilumatobacteraceae bacterium]|nr:uncharacterized protein [Ilumatobacteraceae bacterium]
MELDDAIVAEYSQDPQPYRDMWSHTVPPWLDELDLSPAPPHNRMGTRSLPADDWFVVDELRSSELALRRRLLSERPDDVFACLPAAEDAAVEVLELVRGWTVERGLTSTDEPTIGHLHPLAAAGLLVQDDLCIMNKRDDEWRLDGAMLCFPAVWRLQEKLGRGMSAIHEPIGHYDELESRVDRFFDRMRVGQPIWRRNLSLKPTHSLFLPISKTSTSSASIDVASDGSPYWIRSERQTLTKLAGSGAILFAIRTQIAPVSVLLRRPDIARGIVTMYSSWDAEMNAFKMADSNIADTLLPWLAAAASTGHADDIT